MEIVLCHLTRMIAPRICIAGIDPQSALQIRPVTPKGDPITRRLLRAEGGELSLGTLVDFGELTPQPSPPETEDHEFKTDAIRDVRDLDGDELLDLLGQAGDEDIHSAFGPCLEPVRGGYALEAGSGERSLAIVTAGEQPSLEVDRYGRLRVRVPDLEGAPALSLNDVRFYQRDQKTIEKTITRDVNKRLKRGVPCTLALGLARAVELDWDDRERHWLQANALILEDRPVGERP
jgi:hypothetical protein